MNDPSGTSLKAAKITISGAISADQLGFLGGVNTQHFTATGDTLTATTASFNAANDTYTFEITGTGTAAEYQTVLREVDYGVSPNPGTDPTVGGTDTQRSVSWALSTDGTTFGTAATSTIDVLHSATVAAGNIQNFIEGQGPVVIEPFVSFSDTDTITKVQVALPRNEFLSSQDQVGFINSSGTSLVSTLTLTSGKIRRCKFGARDDS